MSWEDVYFERNLKQEDIIKALAHVFEIEEDAIIIEFGSLRWRVDYPEHIKMLCGLEIIRGEFPIHLEIIPLRGELVPEESKRYLIVGRLCDLLNSPALVTSDLRTDYIWTLIRGEENYQYVSLEGDKLLDQQGDLMELEIDDYLYKFSQHLPHLERTLGSTITCKDFEIEATGYRAFFMNWVRRSSKEDLLQALSNIRPEAKRMYREDWLQEVIDSLEKPSES